MTNKDKYFKGQQETETLIGFFRHHWITLVREFIYFIFFLLILAVIFGNIDMIRTLVAENGQMQVLFAMVFIALTLYMHHFFMRIFNYFMDIGIITDMRVIDYDKSLFLKDILDSIDMAEIQNMEMTRQGFLPNLLGYGDIKIFLNASSVVKTFRYIPNLKFYFRSMNLCMEERKSRFSSMSKQEIIKHGQDLLETHLHSEENQDHEI